MPSQLISASGTQNGLIINNDGSINTQISGIITVSGAGNFSVTGSIVEKQVVPTNSAQNNPLFNLTFSGGVLTRAVQFIGAGSYVKDLSYNGTTLAQAGSWY